MVNELQAVVRELGGHHTLGRTLSNDRDLRDAIRQGFPHKVVDSICRRAVCSVAAAPGVWPALSRTVYTGWPALWR